MVLVLCPTRDRPDDALAMAMTVLATSQASVAFYIDDDQIGLYQPVVDFAASNLERVRCATGPRIGLCAGYNELAKIYPASVYGLGIDDSRFLSPGWDTWIEKQIDQFPGRIGVVAVTREGLEHAQFCFVSREWVQAVGWFACPKLFHFCPDTVLQLLGEETSMVWARPVECCIHHDERPSIDGDKVGQDAQAFLMWCATDKRRVVERLRAAREVPCLRS